MIVVVLNPAAGRGVAQRAAPALEGLLLGRGEEIAIRTTAAPGQACGLACTAALDGARVVAAAGGDGTVHDVANGLRQAAAQGASAALGVVPLGSGNDFARAVGLPSGLEEACERLFAHTTRRVDLGRVTRLAGDNVLDIQSTGHEFFANSLGAGFTASVVVETLALHRLTGVPLYMTALLRAVGLRYRTAGANITVDGQRSSMPVTTVDVMNGQWEGGGFWMAPSAQPDDGRLELVSIKAARRLPLLGLVSRILKGAHTDSPLVSITPALTLDFEFDQQLAVHADGELLARAASALSLEVVTSALAVVA